MKKIITTVGTSLFTNYMDVDVKSAYGEGNYTNLEQIENLKNKSAQEFNIFKYDINIIKTIIQTKWLKGIVKKGAKFTKWEKVDDDKINIDASAEISSLNKIIVEKDLDDIVIYFFTSDTVLSKLSAEILKEFFETNSLYQGANISAKIEIIEGINVLDRNKFLRTGLENLITKLDNISGEYYDNIILNITGGFKGLIPYLTIWAQVHYVPIVYIFEESEQLITLPQTPINMDLGIFEKYSNIFDELDSGNIEQRKNDFINKNDLYDFPTDIIREEKDGDYSLLYLDPLVKILWKKYKSFKRIYFPSQSKYFDFADKKTLNTIFREMYDKINPLNFEQFNLLKDNKIKHAQLEDSWIYKTHCCGAQFRIQYKYDENEKLIIYNFVRIRSSRDDTTYVQQMKKEYDNLKEKELVTINI